MTAPQRTGHRFWRALRLLSLTGLLTPVALHVLKLLMPEWFAFRPGAVYGLAMLWGALVALALEEARCGWLRRRRAAALPRQP